MASITTQDGGRRLIQFIAADKRRRSVRLGKVSMRQAEAVRVKVEDLLAATITGHTVARETSEWLRELDDALHDRLAAVGLVQPRRRIALGPFIDEYIAARTDVKATTATVYRRARKHLLHYFGADKPLEDITPGDAERWRVSLLGRGLAENTVRRTCGIAKQLMGNAVRHRLIAENPFAGLTATVKGNARRLYFVSEGEAARVLEACPDAEWRLLFALGRYGGLRVPSEVLGLRWSDIDWQGGRFTVTSPKTAHYEGKESRVVPIFPELRPYLLEAFEHAPAGAEYCITTYRAAGVNLRTRLLKIIRKAGLNPWPKPWQNLRATRETELADSFPSHVVTAWIGNSVQVAVKHYLQITDDYFARAAGDSALQNALQHAHAPGGNGAHAVPGQNGNPATCRSLRKDAAPCNGHGAAGMGQSGLEPPTSPLSGVRSSQLSY